MNIWKAIVDSKLSIGRAHASGFGVFCLAIILVVGMLVGAYL